MIAKKIENKPLMNKILFLESNSEFYSYFRNMYLTLSKFCKEIIYFNRRDHYFKYGKDKMNSMLLELIKKEKPEYVFTWLTWDEFHINTLLAIRKISPQTKTVAIFGDDIHQFDDFSRYYSILFDYSFTTLKSFIKRYKDDGLNNIFFTSLTDTLNFIPMKTKKKYDVTFIGTQKEDKAGRYELIKHLMENGIKVKVFGFGWENYPDLKGVYGGVLNDKEMVKVINETKINLCFSKNNFGHEQMKAKVFEVNSCKSFLLCEYASDYLDYFKEGKEIIFFKNKEEMLDKVKYYLKNEKERERMAQIAYEKTIKEYGIYKEMENFFKKTLNDNSHQELMKIKEKTFEINSAKFSNDIKKLKDDLKDFDYVCFRNKETEFLPYKNYLQAYSLKKTKKDISCCNYYVSSNGLGDYLLFFARDAFGMLDRESALSLLTVDQLVLTKRYFLKNLDKIKDVIKGKKIDFITKENTAFVAIPLIRIKKVKTQNYNLLKKAFDFKFKYKIYSIFYQRNFISDKFTYHLIKEILFGRHLIIRTIFNTIKDKNIFNKLNKLN